jgi:hypothetical protein
MKMIDITSIKLAFISQFPLHPFNFILQSEPDKLSTQDFLAKVPTWLAILNAEKSG